MTERDQMIVDNIPLVYHLARKKCFNYHDLDDLVSVGCIGLVKAVDRFDPSKGCKLGAFLCRVIVNEIGMYLRKTKKFKREIHYENMRQHNRPFIDSFASAFSVESEVNKSEMMRAIKQLSEKEKKYIHMRYFQGVKQGDAAKLMDCSQCIASRFESKTLKKLKVAIG